jgi:hypothetical protein
VSDELEAVKQVAAHPVSWIAAAGTAISWLGNRLWRAHRLEIENIQKVHTTANTAVWKEFDRHRDIEAKLFDQMREHEKADGDRFERQEAASRDRHDEMMALVGDIRADIAGLKK